MEDYAKLASSLTDSQRAFFERDNLLVRFPAQPMRSHLPHLQLWASLSTEQRRSAGAEGVAFHDLSASQQSRFRNCFFASLEGSIIEKANTEAFLQSSEAVPIRMKLTTLRTASFAHNLETIQAPGNATSAEMVKGGTLVQFRFVVLDSTIVLTAFRLLQVPRSSK
ncbi:MAG: hypothetical protein H6534_08960 [Chthonomonadaceae bacterium]|nr:hypothetical protein [Chthonomonadaceae bacterium]